MATAAQTRSFCYVDDLIEGLDAPDGDAADVHRARSTSAIPANSPSANWRELVIEMTGSKSRLAFQPAAAGRSEAAPARHRQGARDARLAADRSPLREGLVKTIAYFDRLLQREAATAWFGAGRRRRAKGGKRRAYENHERADGGVRPAPGATKCNEVTTDWSDHAARHHTSSPRRARCAKNSPKSRNSRICLTSSSGPPRSNSLSSLMSPARRAWLTISLSAGRRPPLGVTRLPAVAIATLVLAVSVALRHFATLQTQPLHRFLWNGLAAAGVAVSLLLAALFLLKVSDDYSRATFLAQSAVVTVAVLAMRADTARPGSIGSFRPAASRRVALCCSAGSPTPTAIRRRLAAAGVRVVKAPAAAQGRFRL